MVGWSSENILRLLEVAFESNEMCLVLRKMPKDHLKSIKQQKNLVFIYKNKNVPSLEATGNTAGGDENRQRKHSFSDIFDLSEEFIMEDSSDEDEEDYADFTRNIKADESTDLVSKQAAGHRRFGNLFEKTSSASPTENKSRAAAKLSAGGKQKATNKNRLIRSMQNLLSFDRSRSNSTENDECEAKSSRRKSKRLWREDRDAEKALGQINLGFFQEIITWLNYPDRTKYTLYISRFKFYR